MAKPRSAIQLASLLTGIVTGILLWICVTWIEVTRLRTEVEQVRVRAESLEKAARALALRVNESRTP